MEEEEAANDNEIFGGERVNDCKGELWLRFLKE